MNRWWVFAFCFILVVLGVALPGLHQAQGSVPRFEPGPCPFVAAGASPQCGRLIVPESRVAALADSTNEIAVAVAVFPARSPHPAPDPIIYLDGGPGGHSLDFAEFYIQDFSRWNSARDIIFIDQRGVGFSEPRLDCPEVEALDYDLLDEAITADEALARWMAETGACLADLSAAGVNLSAYNSTENAADVADLVKALGYEQVNLFGISYGTRPALTILRDHPAIVRSAVLDAVYPPEVNAWAELAANADRAFDLLFAACAQDAACDYRYPDLEAVFYQTVERLNAAPQTLTFDDIYTEETLTVRVTGDLLVSALFSLLYDTEAIPALPSAIHAASEGRYERFIDETLASLFYAQYFSEAFYDAVECSEEFAFTNYEAVLAGSVGVPDALRQVFLPQLEQAFAYCPQWVTPSLRPEDDQPVVSDIPTLLTVGEYDPITPPAWAERAARSLSNSTVLVFPGVGHSAFYGGACPRSIITRFFDDPLAAPDASCIDAMVPPRFALPPVTEITLRPVRDTTLDFAGVAPVGWVQAEPGVFTLDPNASIPAIAYRFPESVAGYVERVFVNGYGLDGLPAPDDTRTVGDFSWDIYRADDVQDRVYGLFAITTADGKVYVIAVVSGSPDERAFLYEALLLPALEAFEAR